MRKYVLIFVAICLILVSQGPLYANPMPLVYFNEFMLYHETTGGWAIEVAIHNNIFLDECYITSQTDTAYLKYGLTAYASGYYVMGNHSLTSNLTLNSTADVIDLYSGDGQWMEHMVYGASVGANVLAPLPDQSISIRENNFWYWCQDNAPSMGTYNTLEGTSGTIQGHVYNDQGEAIGGARVVSQTNDIYVDFVSAFTDADGFYTCNRMARLAFMTVSANHYTDQNDSVYICADSVMTHDFILTPSVAIEDGQPEIPEGVVLMQNHPNPFNTSTAIQFGLPAAGQVIIDVLKVDGSLIDNIANQSMSAGMHKVGWDAGALPSGVYVYALQVNGITLSRKMIHLK